MTESLQVHTIVHTITNHQPHCPNHKNTKYRLIHYFVNCLISGYLNNANPKNQIFNMELVLKIDGADFIMTLMCNAAQKVLFLFIISGVYLRVLINQLKNTEIANFYLPKYLHFYFVSHWYGYWARDRLGLGRGGSEGVRWGLVID